MVEAEVSAVDVGDLLHLNVSDQVQLRQSCPQRLSTDHPRGVAIQLGGLRRRAGDGAAGTKQPETRTFGT